VTVLQARTEREQRILGSMNMSTTKLFCVKKDNSFIAWDGKTITDRPSQAGRFSKTLCQRKYPDYEKLTFPEAYDKWYAERKASTGR
jgi:hypothetical protein